MRHPTVRERGSRARLEDFEARFVLSGVAVVEPRFLGLVASPGGEAHGVRVELSEAEWESITGHEAGYQLVEVHLDSGPAWALVLDESACCAEALPSRRYARLLVEGAEYFDLPVVEVYRDAARRGSPITVWLARPIALLRDHAPWLGGHGTFAVLFVALFAALAGVVALLWAVISG